MIAPERGWWSGVTHIAPAALYVTAVFVGGSLSGGETYVPLSDKQIHAIAYGVMVPLLFRALRFVRPASTITELLAASATFSSVLGALLEVWQAFLPHRDAELFDWVADTVGAVIAAGSLALLALIFRVIDVTSEE